MTRPLLLRTEAKQDIRDAFDWYEDQKPGLGQAFLREARRALRSVQEHPERYPKIHNDTQRALLNRFPYSVLYAVESDRIVVLACFHGSRDPKVWRARSR